MEYLLTVWLMWPIPGAGEIIRVIVDSHEACLALVQHFADTIAADGVTHWQWSCREQIGV